MTQSTPQMPEPEVPQNGATSPAAAPSLLKVSSFGMTHPGKHREKNEDQFVTATLMRALWVEQSSVAQSAVHYAQDRGHVLIVADGVGGERGGEQASALAVGAIENFLLNALHWLIALDASEEASVLHEFRTALRSADACVYAAAKANAGLRGMGTTLTMAYSRDTDLFVAHAGDSRCYLYRDGALHQITRDDTLVQALVDNGALQPEDVATNELRHVITKVVGGTSPGVQAEVHRVRLQSGDVLVLCTDGLSGMLPDEQIRATLLACPTPQQACEQLVKMANDAGGEDNVTVIVACYT